jgi:hypothetical protein
MAGEPIEVPPLESRAGARVRPRTLLCAALRRGIASILVKKDLAEVCPLSRGMMSAHRLNPCAPHYRPAFASSALLYPQPYQPPLRLACPFRQGYGLTTFRLNDTDGLGPAFPPTALLSM